MHVSPHESGRYHETLEVVVERRVEDPEEIRLNRKSALGAFFLVMAVVVGVAGPAKETPFFASVLGMAGVSLLRSGFHQRRATKLVTKSLGVGVSPAGIKVEGFPPIPAEAIAHAHFQAPLGSRGPTVRCLDTTDKIVFEAAVPDREAAEALLRSLGRDVAHQRASHSVESATVRSSLVALALVIGVFVLPVAISMAGGALGFGRWSALPACLAPLALLALLAAPTKLDVGLDGLSMHWFWRQRFIRWHEVAGVERAGRGLRLVLVDGRTVKLTVPRGRGESESTNVHLDALYAQIDEARHGRPGGEGAALSVTLARGDRPIGEWREALSTLEAGGDYRQPAARVEELWAVVEDPSAPEDVRVGAALALRATNEAAPRLRVAAQAVASPRLRVALETAADPAVEEAALDEALSTFEHDAKRR